MVRRTGLRLSMGNVAAKGSGSQREVCEGLEGGGGGRRGERRAVGDRGPERKACLPHNGAPWRPLGGQCAPWDPRFSAPAGRPGSSCLLRTRPSKCAHLILNPLRRFPCERGKRWPRQSFTNRRSGSPGARRNVCATHANGADHLEKQSSCPEVGEQNQLRALQTSIGSFDATRGPEKFSACFPWKGLPIKCLEKPAELGKVISHPGICTVFPISFLCWPLWSVV